METLWHALTTQDVFERLESSLQGLREEEVLARRADVGSNTLPEHKRDGWERVLARQFMSPMILVLLAAVAISLVLRELVDAGVIATAILVNTAVGFIQEYKANRALAELRSLVQPRAVVMRDSVEVEVEAGEIVPGDLLVLRAGDRVTADARVVDVSDLLVTEAALTGESLPIRKKAEALAQDAALAERGNMVFAGTHVMGGAGRAVVVATGARTQLGTIAVLVQQTPDARTPLQTSLARLARGLAILVIVMVGVVFALGLAFGRSAGEMFAMSVALAVSAIPEGMVISVTVILAIGMQRILHRKALVRRLIAAETLGSVSVICADKTGTITQGEMRVTHLVSSKQMWTHPFPLVEEPGSALRRMFEVMALCNDAVVIESSDEPVRGSPTERALMEAVLEQGLDVKTLAFEHPRVDALAFDSAYKYMVTAHASGNHAETFLKGAPDVVVAFCDRIQVDGHEARMTRERLEEVMQQVSALSCKGIRLLALAAKRDARPLNYSRSCLSRAPVDPTLRRMTTFRGARQPVQGNLIEYFNGLDESSGRVPLSRKGLSGFTFLGLVGLRDPLRDGVRAQIALTKGAGIRTILLTGDHPQTARAIGAEAGLAADPASVAVGSELDRWSDEELERRVPRISIYARVEPRHKIRIVHAWQARGEVVAMTGDGVNDAPALKAADIGVAVGSGTQVAKQAADMVLLDNNLGTITDAVEEGRVIFDNVRKSTVYLLAGSFTELILIGAALLGGLPLPLLAAQILWINLVTDSFPAMGLTLEPAEKGLMRLPPRPRGEPVLNAFALRFIFLIALISNVSLVGLYVWLLSSFGDLSFIRTMMFVALGLDTLIYLFSVRTFRSSLFASNPFSNGWLFVGALLGFSLLWLAVTHPFFRTIFEIASLRLSDWALLLMIGAIKLVMIEIAKEFFLVNHRPQIQTSV